MNYIKNYAFVKRTFLLLSPLFLLTLASKELAFYSPSTTISPIFGNFSDDINSIRKLEEELGINNSLPNNIQSYGDLMIQKTSGQEIWIEQENPLSGFKYGQDFKYEKLEESNREEKKIKIIKLGDGEKYQIKKSSFDSSEIKEKGGLSLLTVFELTLNSSDSKIPITHIAPLSDLVNVNEKQYSVAKVEDKDNYWISQNREDEYTITLRKDENQQLFNIELAKKGSIPRATSYLNGDLSSLAIKHFYILYNEDPPLDPAKYFTNQDSQLDVVSDFLLNPKAKKVFLSRWNKEKKYEFSIDNNFWKSTCTDPYKVGGFIDQELNGKPFQIATKKLEKKNESGSKYLERQKSSYVDFRPDVKQKPSHSEQYYWKQQNIKEQWVPSDDNGDSWKDLCENLDNETKIKFEEYLKKELYREPSKNKHINSSIIPEPLKLKLDSKPQLTSSSENFNYPKSKIVQSSFRAWGNTYNSEEIKGPKIKEKGIYSSVFERAVKTEHKFEISIDKETWKKELINNEKLTNANNGKKPQENPDISSLIEVSYPISFSFYDPISNYLRKHKLLLKTELDLSYLYLQSHYSREVFRFDIGKENKVIGHDYQGFDPEIQKNKKKEYGLDGILSLIAGLELDSNKNLKITLTAQTSGFVNTKNPSCDLRHRLYKIDSSFSSSSSNLNEKWKCSSEQDWKYRDYIHIPSFLIFSLTGEPEISTFYFDNNSALNKEESKDVGKIKTLKQFEENLEKKAIKKVIFTDETNNGEVYFKDIASYEVKDEIDLGEKFQLTSSSWFITNQQYIYYYTPRRQENKIKLDSFDKLKSLKFYVSGSKNSYNSFFYSGHFNTIKTLCINNKYSSSSSSSSSSGNDCADGINYEKREEDKNYSELTKYDGSQAIEINLSQIEINPVTVNFRTVLNRAKDDGSSNSFSTTKTKLESLFKDNSSNPESSNSAMFSLLAVWYSLELRIKDGELFYTTKIRPISMVSEPIKNSTAHKTSGASGSAGFEITKIELNYS